MGARPSSFKKGGGYLNEVDATIVGYTFEVGDTVEIKKGARKGEDFTPLSLVPQFKLDDDDDIKTQRLLIGDAAAYGEVSEDGLTLGTPEGQGIGLRSEAGIFIDSLCNNGFSEENFSDSETEINYEPMIGTRVRLVQEVNVEKTKSQGKQEGKNGKLYDRKDLKVATVHALPEEAPAKGKATAAKPAAGKAVAGKPAGKQPKGVDIAALATETLLSILGDAPKNTIAKSKLSMAVLKKLMKDDNREPVREWLFEDDNLEAIEGVTFDAKKQTISLDE